MTGGSPGITWSQVVQQADTLRPAVLDQFLEGGGLAVGFTCAATPVEIFDAAGVLPYRIRALGRQERNLADSRMSRFNCSYCRSCLQLCMEGEFDFLAGVVETNGCDHLRGMFENWQVQQPDRFFHYLRVPHLTHADALAVFREELGLLRDAVAALAGRDVTDEDIAAATALRAENRALMAELVSLRERSRPGLTGAETLALQLLESASPPHAFGETLRGLLPATRQRQLAPRRARLFLGGSATDELPLLERLEQVGVHFVADGLCYGARGAPLTIPEDGDALDRLAGAYLGGLYCPRMFEDYPRRLEHYLACARRAGAHGALLMHNKFCDLHGVDNVQLRNDMEAAGLPVLLVEKEYGAAADLGRLETRLQAFLERIGR